MSSSMNKKNLYTAVALHEGITYIFSSHKIGNLNVHIKTSFHPEKNLFDIMLSMVKTRLNEKPA